jgi:hypothetical protein
VNVSSVDRPLSGWLQRLIDDALRGETAASSGLVRTLALDAEQTLLALEHLEEHQDASSFHLLMALRRLDPHAYSRVAAEVRAQILCSALQHVIALDDWGYLDPSGSYDGPAAAALLETGDVARSCLVPILDDKRSAKLFGSEAATMSTLYEYRRCDFAYRYLCLLTGKPADFDAVVHNRDLKIEQLKRDLLGGQT